MTRAPTNVFEPYARDVIAASSDGSQSEPAEGTTMSRLKVCDYNTKMCFEVRADTLEPLTTECYDPWCNSHRDPGQLDYWEWLERRAAPRYR